MRVKVGAAVAALALLFGALAAAWLGGVFSGRAASAAPRLHCLSTGADMLWVPSGRFMMGDDVFPEEGPVREVEVRGFWMDRTEVTNEQFAAFVQATGHVTEAERRLDPARHPGLPAEMLEPGAVVFVAPKSVSGAVDVTQWWRFVRGANWRRPGGPGTDISGRGQFPVVAVTHADALAYARWKGHALPTEAQWEWAARGGPHGEAGTTGKGRPPPQPAQANTWQGLFPVLDSGDDGFTGLAPVGCYAANALGLHDLVGNAWEHTADAWAMPAAGAAAASAPQHVIKGGSYLCAPNYCMRYRAAARQPQDASLATSHVGFRTIRPAPDAAP